MDRADQLHDTLAGAESPLRPVVGDHGQFAAEDREKRPPEPYKGKGIKYADEVIRRKVGKTGAKK